ncbi:MAG: hypothetical protein AAGF60_05905 [Pseudomonadota bacterium]
MNAIGDPRPDKPGEEPAIILVGIKGSSYYVVKGDEFMDQLLLVDGKFPFPIVCLNFETMIDATRILGGTFSVADCWALHPEVVNRLRDEKKLIESHN